jgi:hypothetical protein
MKKPKLPFFDGECERRSKHYCKPEYKKWYIRGAPQSCKAYPPWALAAEEREVSMFKEKLLMIQGTIIVNTSILYACTRSQWRLIEDFSQSLSSSSLHCTIQLCMHSDSSISTRPAPERTLLASFVSHGTYSKAGSSNRYWVFRSDIHLEAHH